MNKEPTRDQVKVKIIYESDHDDGYADEFPLDTNLIRGRTYVTSSTSPESIRTGIVKSLQGIHEVLKGPSLREVSECPRWTSCCAEMVTFVPSASSSTRRFANRFASGSGGFAILHSQSRPS